MAAVSCLWRAAAVRAERVAWTVMGAGLLSWTFGELCWTLAFNNYDTVPVPSVADAGYLLYYPAAFVTLVLLFRERVREFRSSHWLDGAIAALAVGVAGLGHRLPPDRGGHHGRRGGHRGEPRLPARRPGAAEHRGRRSSGSRAGGPAGPGSSSGRACRSAPRRTASTCCSRPRAPTWRADCSTPPGRSPPCSWDSRPGSPRRAAPRCRWRAGGWWSVPFICGLIAVGLESWDHFERLNDAAPHARHVHAGGRGDAHGARVLGEPGDDHPQPRRGPHGRAHRTAQPAQPDGRPRGRDASGPRWRRPRR